MYKCMFPECDYEVSDREKIDYHHIKPKELGGSDNSNNRIFLCPIHHRYIYVENVKYGHHSIKRKESIIIRGMYPSTAGTVLHFTSCEDELDYFYMYSKKLLAQACEIS